MKKGLIKYFILHLFIWVFVTSMITVPVALVGNYFLMKFG